MTKSYVSTRATVTFNEVVTGMFHLVLDWSDSIGFSPIHLLWNIIPQRTSWWLVLSKTPSLSPSESSIAQILLCKLLISLQRERDSIRLEV